MSPSNRKIELACFKKHPYLFLLIICFYYAGLIAWRNQLTNAGLFILEAAPFCIALVILFVLGYRVKKGKWSSVLQQDITHWGIYFLAIYGFALRVLYMLSTDINTRQHDVNKIYGDGHLGYIMYLVNHHTLPTGDPTKQFQFYHPPLHHIISALWYGFNQFLGVSQGDSLKNLQILLLFYSGCILIVSYKIWKELKIQGKGLLFCFTFVAFHPTFIFFSASINNDPLAALFLLCSVLYLIRWYQKPTGRNIMLLAFALGFGMMTKLSVGLMAIPIGLTFFWKFILAFQNKKLLYYIKEYALFGLISIPLGMWFPIKNYILYQTPFNYVPHIGEVSGQSIIQYNILPRFLDFSLYQFKDLTLQGTSSDYLEHNIFIALLKTSVFGEWDMLKANAVSFLCGTGLFWVHILIVLIGGLTILCWAGKQMIKPSVLCYRRGILFLTIVVYLLFQFLFCIEYPAVCTQDFRYLAGTIPLGIAFYSITYQQQKKRRWGSIVMEKITGGLILSFAILSLGFFVSGL